MTDRPADEAKRPPLTAESTVAALVPHFRCEQWLGDCLSSLVEQTRPLDAIVVIDDGSGDPPVDIVRQFPQVTLLASPETSGPYRLGQQVIDDTSYDAYMLQDADDWSSHDRLEILLAAAEESGAEIVGSQEVRVAGDRGEIGLVNYPLDVNAALKKRPTAFPVRHGALLLARELIVRAGGFATGLRYSADTEFLRRAAYLTRIVNVPHYCYFWRMWSGSLTTAPETGLASAPRRALIRLLHERAKANALLASAGELPDLAPYVVAPPLALTPVLGPSLAAHPRLRPPLFCLGR